MSIFALTCCEPPRDGIRVKFPWCKVICVFLDWSRLISQRLSRIGISDGPIKSLLWIKFEFSTALINWRWRNSSYKRRFRWRIGARCDREIVEKTKMQTIAEEFMVSTTSPSPEFHLRAWRTRVNSRVLICSIKRRVERMIIMLPTFGWTVFLISIVSLFGF